MTAEPPVTFIQLSGSNRQSSPVAGDVECSTINDQDVTSHDMHVHDATDIQSVTSL